MSGPVTRLLLLLLAGSHTRPAPSPALPQAAAYLTRYGYLGSGPRSAALLSPAGMQDPIRRFQQFAGLEVKFRVD